jgi:hypothetical protein
VRFMVRRLYTPRAGPVNYLIVWAKLRGTTRRACAGRATTAHPARAAKARAPSRVGEGQTYLIRRAARGDPAHHRLRLPRLAAQWLQDPRAHAPQAGLHGAFRRGVQQGAHGGMMAPTVTLAQGLARFIVSPTIPCIRPTLLRPARTGRGARKRPPRGGAGRALGRSRGPRGPRSDRRGDVRARRISCAKNRGGFMDF